MTPGFVWIILAGRLSQITVKTPFEELRIIGVIRERSYIIEPPILRIYLQLSHAPPLGWSYMFSVVWQGVAYPAKRPAGVEGDAVWIECDPEEVRECHLPELERAVAQTNATYEASVQQSAIAKQHKKELNRHSRAQLDELSNSLDPNFHSRNRRGGWVRSGIRMAWSFLKRPFRNLPGKDEDASD